MPRDARLEAAEYIGGNFTRDKKLNFSDLFRVPADQVGKQSPWNLGHFTSRDFIDRVRSRERTLNPVKGFVDPDNPTQSEAFVGIGRFNPDDQTNGYDFSYGRPMTASAFSQDPAYNPLWMEKFNLSPVRDPSQDLIKYMPSMNNPDPRGFLASRSQVQADQDAQAQAVPPSQQPTLQQDKTTGQKVEEEIAAEE